MNRKVKEGLARLENHSDSYGHFISASEKFLEGFYLKLVHQKDPLPKICYTYPTMMKI